MRVALCFFGVISRSIRITWPGFVKHVVRPLESHGHVVDIFGFNVDVGTAQRVDLNNTDVRTVPFTMLDEMVQSDVDVEVLANAVCQACVIQSSRVLDGAPSDTARGCVPHAACRRVSG